MTAVLLLHSALGLRPAVRRLAERLCQAGHAVAAPDLLDGHVGSDVSDGVRQRDRVGEVELVRRATAAADALGEPFAVIGFSLGGGLAQHLVETRQDVVAAAVLHNSRPTRLAPGSLRVPLQVHVSEHDPWVQQADTRALAAISTKGQLFAYPGAEHLFMDEDLPDHVPSHAALAEQRLMHLLGDAGQWERSGIRSNSGARA